jgi:hypothetical protein
MSWKNVKHGAKDGVVLCETQMLRRAGLDQNGTSVSQLATYEGWNGLAKG